MGYGIVLVAPIETKKSRNKVHILRRNATANNETESAGVSAGVQERIMKSMESTLVNNSRAKSRANLNERSKCEKVE